MPLRSLTTTMTTTTETAMGTQRSQTVAERPPLARFPLLLPRRSSGLRFWLFHASWMVDHGILLLALHPRPNLAFVVGRMPTLHRRSPLLAAKIAFILRLRLLKSLIRIFLNLPHFRQILLARPLTLSSTPRTSSAVSWTSSPNPSRILNGVLISPRSGRTQSLLFLRPWMMRLLVAQRSTAARLLRFERASPQRQMMLSNLS